MTYLEWWVFPAADVAEFIEKAIFTHQHGAGKTESGTYWVRIDAPRRKLLATYETTSERLMDTILAFSGQDTAYG